MFAFKAFTLCVLMYITCSLPHQDDSGSTDQSTQNISVIDYPVKLPLQVLKQLIDISEKSKGLSSLWRYASFLTRESLLKDKYTQTKFKACRGMMFCRVPDHTVCTDDTTCLNRTQLVSYYNELVIQMRTAEHLINTSISKEIQENYMDIVNKTERNIIELLHKSILPLLDTALNTTSNGVNCSSTERIVNQKISFYSNCASIQTANIFLSQVTLDLYRLANATYVAQMKNASDHSLDTSEMIISDHEENEEWCILQ